MATMSREVHDIDAVLDAIAVHTERLHLVAIAIAIATAIAIGIAVTLERVRELEEEAGEKAPGTFVLPVVLQPVQREDDLVLEQRAVQRHPAAREHEKTVVPRAVVVHITLQESSGEVHFAAPPLVGTHEPLAVRPAVVVLRVLRQHARQVRELVLQRVELQRIHRKPRLLLLLPRLREEHLNHGAPMVPELVVLGVHVVDFLHELELVHPLGPAGQVTEDAPPELPHREVRRVHENDERGEVQRARAQLALEHNRAQKAHRVRVLLVVEDLHHGFHALLLRDRRQVRPLRLLREQPRRRT
mmetsp:Transcript_23059/g.48893  ORF Transcript_23059/g.48893 Transcript_23059/m.48893 type:complete len:301 (+) Transcript_23059:471-1373(+)